MSSAAEHPALPMQPPVAIEHIPAPPERDFRERYVRRREPVVLLGLTEGWPARERWTLDELDRRFGKTRVPVVRVVRGRIQSDPRRGLVPVPAELGALIDEMRRGDAASYLMAPLDELPSGLGDDIGEIAYCAGAPWTLSKLWCSTAGTRSALHFDLADNLHVQIIGRKRFILFAPSDRRNLYPARLLSGIPNISRVDLDDVDLSSFPDAERAEPWIGEIGPGETMFIPGGWWHHVTTVESSVSVNTWWATGTRLALVAASGAFKRLYGISR